MFVFSTTSFSVLSVSVHQDIVMSLCVQTQQMIGKRLVKVCRDTVVPPFELNESKGEETTQMHYGALRK
jgi:hypothetical protein